MTGSPSSVSLEALLAEEGFVRRLARGLLFDEHRVDDVVQQTWLAALRTPPRDRRSTRAWLARVVRNVAGNQVRTERRTRLRETAAARTDLAPSVDDLLQLEEQRRELLEVLRALPQPYRDVVLARYFDDRTPQDIAKATGVPAATVRTRLARGLELLRETLDRRHGGAQARERWCLALLPLAGVHPAAGMATTSTTTKALLAMKTLLLSGAAILIAVLALRFWPSAAPISEPQPAETVAQGGTQAGERPTPAPPRAPVESPSPRDPFARPDWSDALGGFAGRLLLPDGTPAASELVRVAGIDGLGLFVDGRVDGAGRGPEPWVAAARSGDDGRFVVEGLWPGGSYVLRAGIGSATPHFRTLECSPGPGEVVDLGDIRLEAHGGIEGQVVDADGQPVEGVAVWAADIPGLVFAAAAIDRLDPRNGALLAVPRPSAAELAGERADGWPERLRRYLASELWTDVVDPDGDTTVLVTESPDWAVTAFETLPVARATTGPDGRFRLAGVAPGANVLVARLPGALSAVEPRVVVAAGKVRDVGTLRLREGVTLHGRVVAPDGSPVAAAEVRVATIGLFGFRGVAFAEPAVHTDSDGSFRVSGLPRGKVMVAARRGTGHGWVVRPPASADEPVTVTLDDSGTLEVEVVGPGSAAPAQVRFTCVEGPMLGELSRLGLQQRIDLDGRSSHVGGNVWRITGLVAGVHTLHVAADGWAPDVRMVTVPSNGRIRVRLAPATPFDVVVRAPSGTPVAGAKVWVRRDADPQPLETRSMMPTDYGLPAFAVLPRLAGYTDRDGVLRVTDLPAGHAHVAVLHPRHGYAAADTELPVERVELRLSGTASVEGVLTDGAAPASGDAFCVRADPLDPTAPGIPLGSAWATVGDGGRFAFAGLAPTRYRFTAQPTRPVHSLSALAGLIGQQAFRAFVVDRRLGSTDAELEADTTHELRFDVAGGLQGADVASGRITGEITVDGAAPEGARLVRAVGWLNEETLATVAEDGGFDVRGVEAGRQRLSIVGAGGDLVLWEAEREVPAGAVLRLDLALASGRLAGSVIGPDGRPVANVRVSLEGQLADRANSRATVWTDSAGRFAAAGVPAGTWSVEVDEDDVYAAATGIVVGAGELAGDLEIRGEPRFGVVGTVVRESGEEGRFLVSLRDEARGAVSGFVTDAAGEFAARGLRAGRYTIEVTDQAGRLRTVTPSSCSVDGPGVRLTLRVGGPVPRDR